MDRLTDEVRREPPWMMLFADDIVICKETREELERRSESWRYALERRVMKVSRSKTEYLCRNGGNDDETVKMDDTKVPRIKAFKYLISTVKESGSCEREVNNRVQEKWNGWRKVLGVICDRRLPATVPVKKTSHCLNIDVKKPNKNITQFILFITLKFSLIQYFVISPLQSMTI